MSGPVSGSLGGMRGMRGMRGLDIMCADGPGSGNLQMSLTRGHKSESRKVVFL